MAYTHISGYPSATGRAQDREVRWPTDRRSTTVPRDQPTVPLWDAQVHEQWRGLTTTVGGNPPSPVIRALVVTRIPSVPHSSPHRLFQLTELHKQRKCKPFPGLLLYRLVACLHA